MYTQLKRYAIIEDNAGVYHYNSSPNKISEEVIDDGFVSYRTFVEVTDDLKRLITQLQTELYLKQQQDKET